jgi:hypothetical protein
MMQVLVSYDENLTIPQICCICGAPNPTIKYCQSKEARLGVKTYRVKMTFMECQSCADELKMTSQAISRTWSRIALRAVAIGGGIGFLVGIVLVLALDEYLGGELSTENTNNIVNDFIGPLLVCASIPAVFGMIAGLLPAWVIWRKRIDPATRQRFEILKSPVKILGLVGKTWRVFAGIEDPTVHLDFASDIYGQKFMLLNNRFLA